jgi:DNA repair protein RecO (recombination protein O)
VVLRHSDWGEADRMLNLFSLELGKVQAIAKGVRKSASRKAGHLEPFTRANLLLARGRDLMIVTQAESINAYLALKTDLLQTTYAAYIVELLDRFTYEEGENRELYRLLVDTLARLDASSEPEVAVHYYEIRLLDHIGFRPQLVTCVSCGRKIQAEDQFFSAEHGGVLCPSCGKKTPGARPISMEALKCLRHYQRSGFSEAARLRPSQTIHREIEALMTYYFTYLLERSLNTPPFLRRARLVQGEEGV